MRAWLLRAALALLLSPALALLLPPSLRADTSLRTPAPRAPPLPTTTQAIDAAKQLWAAVRARDPQRIAAAVDARVHLWASLAGLPVEHDYDALLDRQQFARRMTTLVLGGEAATDWQRLASPPPLPLPVGDVTWVGAAVQSSHVLEGEHAKTGDLAFGVRFVGGRARVVAFDVTYGESPFTARH